MHPHVGELQAFIDQELPPERLTQIRDHLASCSACQSRLAELQTRGSQVGRKLARLEPSEERASAAASAGDFICL